MKEAKKAMPAKKPVVAAGNPRAAAKVKADKMPKAGSKAKC